MPAQADAETYQAETQDAEPFRDEPFPEGDSGPVGPGWRDKFSVAAFLQGLGAGAVILALMLAWSALNSGRTARDMQARIPSQAVAIRAAGQPAAPPARPGTDTAANGTDTGTTADATAPVTAHTENGAAHHTAPHAAPPGSSAALAPAPIEGLFVLRPDGSKLPVIRNADNLTPFAAYRRPFARQETDKPIISLTIVDLGLSAAATESAIRAMPPEVSLALSPYATTPDIWVTEARVRGHEVWLTLPIEGKKYPAVDPGPHTLMIDVPASENEAKLNWIMSRTAGYAGFIASSEDATFLNPHPGLRPALNSIYSRGLGFADIGAETGSLPEALALGLKAPYTNIDMILDEVAEAAAIDAQLAALENLARSRNAASAVLHPLPVSYNRVLSWIKTLPDKGLALAPLSANAGY